MGRGSGELQSTGANIGSRMRGSNAASDQSVGLRSSALASALGFVSYQGDLAQINQARVDAVAQELLTGTGFGEFKRATWDIPLFWNGSGTDEERAQFFAIGNAINFRFWELRDSEVHRSSGVIEGEHFGGAMYMWRALKRTLDHGRLNLLDPSFLAELTAEQFNQIFNDDNGQNPLSVGAEDRIANLRDLGKKLINDYNGQFLNVVKRSGPSLETFMRLSEEFRAFDDPVRKLPSLNAIMLSGSGVHPFADEPLPAIDYHLVRHAVRQGMVTPSPHIASKMLNAELPRCPGRVPSDQPAYRAVRRGARQQVLA
jgi:hypothetical protein